MSKKYMCHVCGHYGFDEAPRSPEGHPSFEICMCCGFHYGYDDDAVGISDEQWREKWIKDGKTWFSTSRPPPINWDPDLQLRDMLKK